jgi:hypothetical protein
MGERRGEDRVRIGVLVNQTGKVLRVNLSAMRSRRALVERFHRLRMARQAVIKEFTVGARLRPWQKRGDRRLDLANDPPV